MVKTEPHFDIGDPASNGLLIIFGFFILLISWLIIPSVAGIGWVIIGGLIGIGMIVVGFLRLIL